MKHHNASPASCTSRARALRRLLKTAAIIAMEAVVFSERRKRRLERAAEPAERGCLLLHDFVVEREDVQ